MIHVEYNFGSIYYEQYEYSSNKKYNVITSGSIYDHTFKNKISNELYIASSIGMKRFFSQIFHIKNHKEELFVGIDGNSCIFTCEQGEKCHASKSYKSSDVEIKRVFYKDVIDSFYSIYDEDKKEITCNNNQNFKICKFVTDTDCKKNFIFGVYRKIGAAEHILSNDFYHTKCKDDEISIKFSKFIIVSPKLSIKHFMIPIYPISRKI